MVLALVSSLAVQWVLTMRGMWPATPSAATTLPTNSACTQKAIRYRASATAASAHRHHPAAMHHPRRITLPQPILRRRRLVSNTSLLSCEGYRMHTSLVTE